MTDDQTRTAMARLKAQRHREDDLVTAAAKAQGAVQKAADQLAAARNDYDQAVVELRDALGLARTAEVLGETEGTIRRKKVTAPPATSNTPTTAD